MTDGRPEAQVKNNETRILIGTIRATTDGNGGEGDDDPEFQTCCLCC